MQKNKTRAITIFAILLISAFSVMKTPTVNASGSGNYPPPSNGDWIIDSITTVEDETILLNGNLTIENTGSLTMRNVTLIFNSTYDGEFGIVVKSGGKLYIYDKDDNPSTTSDRSTITANDTNYKFRFLVESGTIFEMKNSELSYCGYGSGENGEAGLTVKTNNTQIKGNTIRDNFYGIYISNSSLQDIEDNTLTKNYYGIFIYGIYDGYPSYGNKILNNDISDNSEYGIYANYVNKTEIKGNTVSNNDYGIFIDYYSLNNTISSNQINSNSYGIFLNTSYENKIDNNTIYSNSNAGIYCSDFTYENIIEKNTIYNNAYGIYLDYFAFGNIISENTIYSNTLDGIYIGNYSNNNEITKNTIYSHSSSGYGGIYIYDSSYNAIENNTIRNNYNGIYLTSSSTYMNRIANNDIYSNTYGIYSVSSSSYSEINSNNIYSNTYGIYLSSSTNNIVSKNTIYSNSYGIYLTSSSYNAIENNTIRNNNNNYGLYLGSSSYNTIANNSIYFNTNYGIYIYSSSYNEIRDNKINNTNYGMYLYSFSNNNLIRNNIYSINNRGLWDYWYSTNNIFENCTVNSSQYDFYIDYNSNATTINTTFNDSRVYVSPDSTLTIKNYLDVHVFDDEANELENAKVSVYENNRTISYSYNEVSYNWIELNGTSANLIGTGDDSYFNNIEIGFTFRYYENNYTQFHLSTNGFISFTPLSDAYYNNVAIPNSNAPNNILAVFWDDLNVRDGVGNIYYKTYETSPNKYTVIEYYNVDRYGSGYTSQASFQIILYENGTIKFQYNDTYFGDINFDYGASATSGIENSDGTFGIQYSYEEALLTNKTAIEFYPYYLTDANGMVSWILLTDRVYENDNITEWNATVEVSHSGYGFLDNPRNVNMSSSHKETFVGDKIPTPVKLSWESKNTNSANLSWTQNNDTDFKNYTVYQSMDNKTWQNIGNKVVRTNTKHTAENLRENTKYYFITRVYDTNGFYADSNVVNLTTDNIPPIAVVLNYSNLQAYSVLLNWTKNDNHDFKNYTVFFSFDNSSWTSMVVITNKNTIQYTASVDENTDYWFKVVVYDNMSASNESNVINFTTPNGQPLSPNPVSYSNLTSYNLTLKWRENTNKDFTNYTIYISTDGTNYNILEVITDRTTTQLFVENLNENTKYWFRIRVYDNKSLFSDGSILTLTTINIPPTASIISYNSLTSTSLNLTWSKNTNSDFKEYRVYYTATNGTWGNPTIIGVNSTTSLLFSNLIENKLYYFKIEVVDTGITNSITTSYIEIRTLNLIPNAVVLDNGTISVNSIVLTWSKSSIPDFSNYTLYISEDSNIWEILAIFPNINTITYRAINLTENAKYYFKMRVYDKGDLFNDSNILEITTANLPPSAINISYANLSAFSIDLLWNENKDHDFSNYTIYFSYDNQTWSVFTQLTNNTTTFFTLNLTERTNYYLKILVYDTGGAFAESNVINITTPNGEPKVVVLSYSSITYNSVALVWTKNIDDDFKNYTLQKSEDSITWETISVFPNNDTTSFNVQNLQENKIYYFKVITSDIFGLNSTSNILEVLVEGKTPNAVVLSYEQLKANSVVLRWTKSSENDFKNYTIYLSTNNDTWTFITEIVNIMLITHEVKNLNENTKYYFKIRVYDKIGLYNDSNIIVITTLNAAPKPIIANITSTENSITITWQKSEISDFAKYEIYLAEDKNFTIGLKVQEITDRNTTSYTFTGLKQDTNYAIKITVYDTEGKYADTITGIRTKGKGEVPITRQEGSPIMLYAIIGSVVIVVLIGVFMFMRGKKKEEVLIPPKREIRRPQPPIQSPPPPLEPPKEQPPSPPPTD